MGKMFQTELLKMPEVSFAGYNCPHPLETKMILTIITSEKTPREVFHVACDNLIKKMDELLLVLGGSEKEEEKEYEDSYLD
jgi:DNA-directed RNA polymerase subunit L